MSMRKTGNLEKAIQEKKEELLSRQIEYQSLEKELARLHQRESALNEALLELKINQDQEVYLPEDYQAGIENRLKLRSFTSAEEGLLFDLGLKLHEFLLEKKKIRPNRNTFDRLDQIETMMNLYSSKIHKVKNDETLDEPERDLKLEYWQRLRDRDIQVLEG